VKVASVRFCCFGCKVRACFHDVKEAMQEGWSKPYRYWFCPTCGGKEMKSDGDGYCAGEVEP